MDINDENAEAVRQDEAERRLFHLCPCSATACQRVLTPLNSVPLPEVDQDAYLWLCAVMQGPDSVRHDLLKHVRRLQWTLRVDVAHFATAATATAQDGSIVVTGPPSPTLLAGSIEPALSALDLNLGSATTNGGKRTSSEETRASAKRVAPSLPSEQFESLAHAQLELAALQEQYSAALTIHDNALKREAQLELALASRDAESAKLRARKAENESALRQIEVMRQAALAQIEAAEAEEAAIAAEQVNAEQTLMAEQRWLEATNSPKLCLTWTGLLGPDRLEALANLVEEVTKDMLLDLPQVRAATARLDSQRTASGSESMEEYALQEEDDVYLDEDEGGDDEEDDDDDDDDDNHNTVGDTTAPVLSDHAGAARHTPDFSGVAAPAGTAAAGTGSMDVGDGEDTEHDPYLEAYPVRWAECYARVRNAGECVLTSRTRLLLTLMFLRLVHNAEVLAVFFGVSRIVCVRVYRRTLCELTAVSRVYGSWPSWKRLVELTSPAEQCAYDIGPDAGVLYGGCTDVKCFRPSNPSIARCLYSSSYGMCSFKYLVIVAPNGHIVHISRAANGSITDDELHREYGTAALMRGYYPDENRPMAYVYDKGLFDTDDFTAKNIDVVMPERLRWDFHLAAPEDQQRIAQLPVINKRAIGRMKTYAAAVATRHHNQAVWDEIMMEVVAFMCNLGPPYPDCPDAPGATPASGLQNAPVPPWGSDGGLRNEGFSLAFVPPRRTYRPWPQ